MNTSFIYLTNNYFSSADNFSVKKSIKLINKYRYTQAFDIRIAFCFRMENNNDFSRNIITCFCKIGKLWRSYHLINARITVKEDILNETFCIF